MRGGPSDKEGGERTGGIEEHSKQVITRQGTNHEARGKRGSTYVRLMMIGVLVLQRRADKRGGTTRTID